MIRKCIHIGFILLLLATHATASSQQTKLGWKQNMEAGDRYVDDRMFLHALACYEKAYEDPAIKNQVDVQLRLLKCLVDCYDITDNGKLFVQTNLQLRDLAESNNADAYVAMSNFVKGKHLHYFGNRKKGYRLCLQALELFKKSPYDQKRKELALFYAALTRMYTRDGRFAEAMQMSQEQEKAVRQNLPKDQIDLRALYRVYAIRSNLFAAEGRMADADSCYAACQRLGVYDIIALPDLTSYLRQGKKYQQLLDAAQHAKKIIQQDGDTCGLLMHYVLRDEAEAFFGLERYREAANAYAHSEAVHDTLDKHASQILRSTVREVVLQEQSLSRHNFFLVILFSGVIILLVIGIFLTYHVRVQHQRNKAMTQNIRKLMFYRNLVLDQQTKEETADEIVQNEEQKVDALKLRFVEVDRQVMKEELFCNPDFGRDELMRLMGVDKNALATIIHRYTGMNVTGYVNSKRMEYAVLLMKEHPDYTLAAIAEACGIKSPATFIRNFRNSYGLTPSEYHTSMQELPTPR